MRSALLFLWLVIASPCGALPAFAQEDDPGSDEPLFTAVDAAWAGGFAVGTVLLAPLDIRIAQAVRDSAFQNNLWLARPAAGFRILGFPGSLLVTGGMYAAGRLADRPVLADIGLHSFEAIGVATAVTLVTKSVAGRARPYVDPENPLDFGLGRGWRNDRFQSFPSGHTTAAFAAAAAVTKEIEKRWPDAELLAGTALFGAATLVGASRLYHNVHWASDVAMGAAIGSFAGWKVVRYTHSHPDNRMDRWLLGMTISPTPQGHAARLWIVPAF
jgi:membrane-associated phospholipid phosphatase